MNQIQNRTKGFTLIELIVVLVIVGLLSGLVMPRLFGTLTHVELKSSVRNTLSFLNQARDLAYYKKKRVKLSFNIDEGIMRISQYTGRGPEMEWNSIDEQRFPDGVRLEKYTRKETTITKGIFDIFFYPAGNTDGGEIFLINTKGRQFIIQVDALTGNARIIQENE